ncbi:MAG: HAD-IG family 5'-nucleotidase [Bdellovibrionaceae bacterium]|nr:HAD-IG family 5'-nucleotidase [Pseudobdellovibrionaceae bacterium]
MKQDSNVFVNRTLNLQKINYIGLDMDHTLVKYHSENFECLAHTLMLEKLVETKGYPSEILDLELQYDRAIRGLVLDKKFGNLLKVSRYGAIRVSYHGLENISFSKQKKIYRSTYIDLSDPNYDVIDTTFSIAFATLFAQLVDLKDHKFPQEMPDYAVIAEDLNYVLDTAHRDESIKSVVCENLEKYIIKDKELVEGLEYYIKSGKKIFLLTNSEFYYTKKLLDYTINPFLTHCSNWQELFEFTIVFAQKPRFFIDQLNFLEIDPETGKMENKSGKIEKGKVYQAGCETTLTSDLNLLPDETLYIGDHIYGDVVLLKKNCAWRTALVVEELSKEIEGFKKAEPYVEKIEQLMDKKHPLEVALNRLSAELISSNDDQLKVRFDELMLEVAEIDKEVSPLIRKQQEFFNPYWGETFRSGIEESYFAHQMERFACIYMSDLKDFLKMSPRSYFRSTKRPLAHEL